MTFPGEPEIDRISAMPSGPERNRLITESYAALSAETARRLPDAANWCTFAVWASRQAGVTIRHQDLAETLRMRLRASESFGGLAGRILAVIEKTQVDLAALAAQAVSDLGPLRRSSEAVSAGNRKVFDEIGRQFSRFLVRFPDLAAISDSDFEDFCGSLSEGDAPHGQGLLREAFRGYRAAAGAPLPERAQRILLANLQIGLHEQTRLQPDIEAALNGALLEPGDLTEFLVKALWGHQSRIKRILRRLIPFYRTPLEKLAAGLAREVRAVVRVLITDQLMTLTLGGEKTLRLGRDLQHPFPECLRELSDAGLLAFLRNVDPTSDSLSGSGALDWADLRDRMHFIADLFRCYQEDPCLFSQPFENLKGEALPPKQR